MIPSKDDIKYWLKTSGKTREWLGKKCGGTSKNTVNNWLSTSIEIPASQLEIIRRLMAEDAQRAATDADPQCHLVLRVALEEYERWEHAALLQTTTLSNYCIEAIRDAYREDMQLQPLPTAERPGAEKQA